MDAGHGRQPRSSSREIIAGITSSAEEKLRATFTQVFSEMAGALSDRLNKIASNLEPAATDLKAGADCL